MLLTFLFGWAIGMATVGFVFDIRRALLSPQQREEAFQQRAERFGGRHV